MRDYYAILGVQPFSEQEVIDAAYRALIKKYHPDKSPDPRSKRRAQEINEAYQALRDPVSRSIYDFAADPAPSASRAGEGGGGSGVSEARPSRPSPMPADPAPPKTDDGFAVVRWSVAILAILFAALLCLCVAMFMAGVWVRVPSFA